MQSVSTELTKQLQHEEMVRGASKGRQAGKIGNFNETRHRDGTGEVIVLVVLVLECLPVVVPVLERVLICVIVVVPVVAPALGSPFVF